MNQTFLRLGLLALLICLTLHLAAAEPVPHTAIEDVVYGHKDGLALTLDVLTPEKDAKGIGIVLVSSGGWHSEKSNDLTREVEGRKTEHWVQGLLQGGYTLFIARHGSMPRYQVPEMVEDIRRSVRFVRHNAAKYGVDPNHLGITSGSSGGHLSLMVGLTGDDGNPDSKDPVEQTSSRVQSIVAWFPPTDLVNFGRTDGYQAISKLRPKLFEEMFGTTEEMVPKLKSISPIEFVTSDDPPVLLIHGDKDFVVPLQQSEIFMAKYKEQGLPVELVVHPGGGHTYWPGILDDYKSVQTWFDKYLKP
jgi:acetyl esterase/lipase